MVMYIKLSMIALLSIAWIAAIVLLFAAPPTSWGLLAVRLVPCYSIMMTLDTLIAIALEQKYMFYPVTNFKCFCGFECSLTGRIFIPERFYRFYKVKNHTKSCLAWILTTDFNNLTPYYANCLARDLREPLFKGLTEDWYLDWAKKKSQLVREGKDPLEEESV